MEMGYSTSMLSAVYHHNYLVTEPEKKGPKTPGFISNPESQGYTLF